VGSDKVKAMRILEIFNVLHVKGAFIFLTGGKF
jgi:hypothetical protein